MIYLNKCNKCGKKYDMMSCPYCNQKNYPRDLKYWIYMAQMDMIRMLK